jgi:DoxX-like family
MDGELRVGVDFGRSRSMYMWRKKIMLSTQTITNSKRVIWTGRTLSGVAIAFLVLDGLMKLFNPAPVVEAMVRLGYPVSMSLGIGIVLLACVTLYAIPRTSFLGAVLLTGYLGGAVATHARVGGPMLSHTLFPIYVAALIWAGLFLRDQKLRILIPVQS